MTEKTRIEIQAARQRIAKETAIISLQSLAKMVYGFPDVTDDDLIEMGLPPRAERSLFLSPQSPIYLTLRNDQ